MLDLNKFKFDEALPFNLVNPSNGEKLDAKIWIHSVHSKKATDTVTEYFRNRKEGDPDMIADDVFLSQLVSKWEGIAEGKKKLECTPENVSRILKEQNWVLLQCKANSKNGEYSPKP